MGFSFVELLAYMAIAALLVLAAIPQFSNYRNNAYDAIVKDELRNYSLTAEAYRVDSAVYPQTTDVIKTLGVTVTPRAYSSEGNNILVCTWDDRWGAVAQSASGKAWLRTSDGEMRRWTESQIHAISRLAVCPLVGETVGATTLAADTGGSWLFEKNGRGWNVAVK